ncbi:MAG: transposase [Chitinophagales bacterium]
MSKVYTFRNKEAVYFTTDTVVGWIDLFTRKELRQIVVESLRYCQANKGLQIHGWCLMSSHLHMLISCTGLEISEVMRSFKTHTSKRMTEWIEQNPESRKEWLLNRFQYEGANLKRISKYKVWQDGSHAEECPRMWDMMQTKLDYIHQNPVVAEIVSEPEHYLYSSARDYSGGKGLLEISFI